MRTQSEIEIGLLLMLAEEADEDGEVLLPVEAAARFNPPLSVIKAEISLKHLYELGLVDWRLRDGRRQAYFVTRKGARTVEDAFHRVEIDGNTSWSPKDGVLLDSDRLVTHITEIPETPEHERSAAVPSGWTINNNIFQENIAPSVTPRSVSSTTAAWLGVLVAVIGIGVALWLAGKF